MPTVVRPARKNTPVRAKPRKAPPAKSRARKPAAEPAALASEQATSWAELAGKAAPAEARRRERQAGIVDAVPTLRFAVLLALACAALTLYVGHLYATQSLVEQVQELRKERHRLVLQQNRLAAEFDRLVEPSVVLDRATALGLRPSGAYGPVIVITD